MIRKVIGALILFPLAVVIVLIAIANRQPVTISLDPFLAERPALTVSWPLFLVILTAVMAGVVIGGTAAWLRQGKWRRAARHARAELHIARTEKEALRQRLDAAERPPARTAIAYRRPPAA